MLNNTIPFLISILFITLNCTQTKELDVKPIKPLLVLNGLFTSDSVIKVQLSSASHITGRRPNNMVSDAKVALEENGVFKEWMVSRGNGIYVSEIVGRPVVGNKYSIRAQAAGFPNVNALDSLPQQITIKQALYGQQRTDTDGSTYTEVTVGFDDPIGQNYYELVITERRTNRIPQQGPVGTYYWSTGSWNSDDPIIKSEGDLDYKPRAIIFSDNLFNNKRCQIKIKNFNPNTHVTLRHVSYTYYMYAKRWIRHSHNKGLDPFSDRLEDDIADLLFKGEPIDMYSNINGGFGIWAGYGADNHVELVRE